MIELILLRSDSDLAFRLVSCADGDDCSEIHDRPISDISSEPLVRTKVSFYDGKFWLKRKMQKVDKGVQ